MSGVRAFPMLATATALFSQGEYENAAQHVIQHLRLHKDEPRGLALLGNIAMHLGALGQAEHFFRKVLATGKADLEVKRNFASVLNQQERLAEALPLYELLEKESDDPALAAIRAIILDKLGRSDEALTLRERLAKEMGDGRPGYWVAYGHSLRSAGRVEEAIAAYRKAADDDVEHGEAWWGLGGIKKKVLTDEDMDAMHRGLDLAIDVRNSAPIHFALARAHHDRGQFDQAFTHYDEGNRQRAESLKYDARELTDEVAEIRRSIDTAFVEAFPQEAQGNEVPVFIVSLPRSGSTLLEQMLGSHPDVEPVGELPYIPAILRSAMEMATRQGPTTVPQFLKAIPDPVAAAMGQDYLRRVAAHRKTDRRYFVDKLPHNWSNILFIRRILPKARFLDIRRNPLDCCFSNFTQSFSSAHASSFALRDIGQCYVDYVALMDHLDTVAPGLVHHVAYDVLVDDPEPVLRGVTDYLRLLWEPAMLEFHKLDRVVRTPSSEQVRRPLNRDGMKVWEPYQQWLDPLFEVLGPLASR